jgi:hypothetical protein
MAPKRSIKAKEIVTDIRAGMTDSELMSKYKLSIKGLQSIFRKLEVTKAIRPAELYGRQLLEADTVDLDQFRRETREYLPVPLTIYEVEHPEIKGVVTDISRAGVRVRGLRAKGGETKVMIVQPQHFFRIDPFGFQATCRWVRREGEYRAYVAGFEITHVEKDELEKLERLIGKLRLAD